MAAHPRWTVIEDGNVLSIEVVAGALLLQSAGPFVLRAPANVRDLKRKIGIATTELLHQLGESTSDTPQQSE